MLENLQALSLDEIRAQYQTYLRQQSSKSEATIRTSMSTAFYLWQKKGADVFWSVVSSDSFETEAHAILHELLRKAGQTSSVSNYLSHLRCFRKFAQNQTSVVCSLPPTASFPQMGKRPSLLPAPTVEQAQSYLATWWELENYRLQEQALDRIFFKLCPHNTEISDILLKTSVLNDFYSTNIYNVYPVAKHILSLQIDKRLSSGDLSLVEDIQKIPVQGRILNFYSFATKYCSHHKPLDYPIYDFYVDQVLRYYRKVDHFAKFQNKDLKNYVRFKSILKQFQQFYGLERYNLKQLDRYLWLLGKESFNRYK